VGCSFRHGFSPGDSQLAGDGKIDSAIDSAIDARIDAPILDAPLVPIVFEQTANHFANNESSVSLHYPNAQLNKSLNIVIVGWVNTHSVTSVTDATGNTYQPAGGDVTLNGMNQALYYACGVAATSTNTVTVTFDSQLQGDVRILEYSGLRATGCFDQIAPNSGSSSPDTSGTATTTFAYELLVASNTTSKSTTGADPAFTSRGFTAFNYVIEDRVVTSVGSYSASATQNGSGDWVMQIATFVGK